MTAPHIPVLCAEMVETLAPRDGGIYIDGTFGAGGYSRALLAKAQCRVFAIDRDPSTRVFAQTLMEEFPGRLTHILGCFSDMVALLAAHGIEAVDGVVLDVGVSSMQIDQPERGFSFRHDGPLDMRMGSEGVSAADIVNAWEEAQLVEMLFLYGEERAARRIARAILKAREIEPITRTRQLAEIIGGVVGYAGGKDPATRSFQALRIQVNDELGEIERGLEAATDMLKPNGKLVVVTFHSLEDRLVKQFLHSRCRPTGGRSRHLPELANAPRPLFLLPKPEKVKAGDVELHRNPRARSATLRSMSRVSESIAA